jgi:hypothetical protein
MIKSIGNAATDPIQRTRMTLVGAGDYWSSVTINT